MTELIGRRLARPGLRWLAVQALASAAAGIVAGRQVGLAWWMPLLAVPVALLLTRPSRGRSLYAALAAAAMAASIVTTPRVAEPPTPEQAGFRAVVVQEPTALRPDRAVLALEAPAQGRVMLYLRDGASALRHADRVRVRGEVRAFDFPRNPGLFDLNQWYQRQGCVGVARAAGREIDRLGRAPRPFWEGPIAAVRRYAAGTLVRLLPQPAAALAGGLLLGDRSGMEYEDRLVFGDAGVAHVLAVSGLHVGIVVGLVWLLMGMVGLHGWWRFGLSAVLVAAYVLVTGARPSAVRAGVMTLALLLSRPTQRRVEPGASLGVAALLLLALDPNALFDSGFQLSFGAVAAIALAVNRFEQPIKRLFADAGRPWQLVRRWVVLPLLASAAATLGAAPLLLHQFHRIQLLAPFAGLLVVALVGLAVPLGLVVLVVNLVSPFAAGIWAATLAAILQAVIHLTRWFAQQDWAMLEPGRLSWLGVGMGYTLMALAWNWRRPRARLVLAVALAVGLNLVVWPMVLGGPGTRVVFLDPGRGDAALLEDSLGHRLLIDAGVNRTGVLRDYLRSRGIRRIDVAVVTHPDVDHYGGLLDVRRGLRIGRLLVPTARGSPAYERMLARWRGQGTRVELAGVGTKVEGLGFRVRFLWPEEQARALLQRGLLPDNIGSLVAEVEFARFRMLFTGDLDDPAILAGLVPETDLLKSPHHGSRNGNPAGIFETLNPEYVVVMGRYPTPAGLEQRLAGTGIHYINTRRDGGQVLRLAPATGRPVPR